MSATALLALAGTTVPLLGATVKNVLVHGALKSKSSLRIFRTPASAALAIGYSPVFVPAAAIAVYMPEVWLP
jgi:hypothetical protein